VILFSISIQTHSITIFSAELVPIDIDSIQEEGKTILNNYDKEKYRDMILDAAGTVLGLFGFDRTVYSSNIKKKKGRRKWYDELR
jgi:hypothetical protein